MPDTNESLRFWERTIEDALAAQDKTPGDRTGGTPIGLLSEAVSRLAADSPQGQDFVRALEGVARRGAHRDASFWKNLTGLIEISGVRQSSLRALLANMVLRATPENVEARAWALLAAASMGRRFTPTELNALSDLRRESPSLWIESAIASEHFDIAEAEIGSLLAQGKFTAADLLARLPAWYQAVGPRLPDIIAGWIAACPRPADKDRLMRWLEVRGLRRAETRLVAEQAATGPIAHSPITYALAPANVNFLSSAMPRRARLNGAVNPDGSSYS